jgi:chloramphenicol-sensitive protein RarD
MSESTIIQNRKRDGIVGAWYAVAAFSLWGVLPLYWKALKQVPSTQILAHRIIWTCIFVLLLLLLKKRVREARDSFLSARNRIYFALGALCIGVNWFIYIWAVNTGHIVETSMGYFINPLFSMLLGVIFLKERLNFWQIVSVCLAFCGVLYMTVQYGKLPWIALSLAVSFGLYGLLRKTSHAESLAGLIFETAFLSPIAFIYLVFRGVQGTGSFGAVSPLLHLLLMSSGIVTAMPLLWFTNGARRIPLSTVGFIQYLTPSLKLFIGVIVFKEPFTDVHTLSFSLIWGALVIYSLSHTPLLKRFKLRKLKGSLH